MRTLRTGSSAMLARAGVSAALALAAVGAGSTASFAATTVAQSVMTLSSTTGPDTGANTLTLTLPTTSTTKFTNSLVGIQFQSTTATAAATASCSTNPATANAVTVSSGIRYISNVKVSVVVPNLTSLSATSNYVLVCAYNQAYSGGALPVGATVTGKANYIVSTAPTLAATPIVPASGPSTGGQVVTIYSGASNFPTSVTAATPLSATLNGVALTGITPVSASAFTAVTPALPASNTAVVLTVTTAGGTVKTASGVYTFKNGISVSPNTVPSGAAAIDVDVTGAGFNTLAFDTGSSTTLTTTSGGAAVGTNTAGAHVYLVQGTGGVYDGTGAPAANKTNAQKSECKNPVVISDNELICTIDPTFLVANNGAGDYQYKAGNLPNGTYTLTVVSNGSVASPTFQSVPSSGATFTVADF